MKVSSMGDNVPALNMNGAIGSPSAGERLACVFNDLER
jgi:hypothetical protein